MIHAWEKFIAFSETLNLNEQLKHGNIKYFVNEYFGKNYIGQDKRARFPIPLWNVHNSTVNGVFY